MQKQEERPCRRTRESCTSGRSSSNGHSFVGCLARQSSDETISQIDHSRAMHIQPRCFPQWTLCTLFGRRCMATLRPRDSPSCQPARCRNWRAPLGVATSCCQANVGELARTDASEINYKSAQHGCRMTRRLSSWNLVSPGPVPMGRYRPGWCDNGRERSFSIYMGKGTGGTLRRSNLIWERELDSDVLH